MGSGPPRRREDGPGDAENLGCLTALTSHSCGCIEGLIRGPGAGI